jgi:hypothetical protein
MPSDAVRGIPSRFTLTHGESLDANGLSRSPCRNYLVRRLLLLGQWGKSAARQYFSVARIREKPSQKGAGARNPLGDAGVISYKQEPQREWLSGVHER